MCCLKGVALAVCRKRLNMARVKRTPVKRSPTLHFRVRVNLWRQAIYGPRGQWEPTTRGRNVRYPSTASRVELAHYLGMSRELEEARCCLVFRD